MLYKLKFALVTVVLVLGLSLCLEKQAYAYTDPGSSLLAFQAIATVFSGVIFHFRRRLRSLFRRNRSSEILKDGD